MSQKAARPDRMLIAILSIIGAIVVLALVVVFTRGGPTELDPTTPEGVVQSYSRAMVDGDYDAARQFLVADVLDNCERVNPRVPQGVRMTIVSSRASGDEMIVTVSIEHASGDFGSSGYEYEESFSLRTEAGVWKLSSTPWELMLCENQRSGY